MRLTFREATSGAALGVWIMMIIYLCVVGAGGCTQLCQVECDLDGTNCRVTCEAGKDG